MYTPRYPGLASSGRAREHFISSTIMDVDSTISSGRSTPAMMNGQGSTTSSSKNIAYNCCWDQCQACFNSSPDLADHIRSIHCVVGGCNASFASQGGLARHVPTHFSQQNSSKVSSQPKAKEESPSKAGMNKRRKLKNKRRRSLPRPHDFFDAQTLDAIRHRAICFNLSAHIESLGKGHSVVFHSTVIAKRKEDSGKIKLLLHWMPEDILPDVWVNESERHQLKTKNNAAEEVEEEEEERKRKRKKKKRKRKKNKRKRKKRKKKKKKKKKEKEKEKEKEKKKKK
ncbi:hypothetical protein GH733_014462, partial [Mirounga leonina]